VFNLLFLLRLLSLLLQPLLVLRGYLFPNGLFVSLYPVFNRVNHATTDDAVDPTEETRVKDKWNSVLDARPNRPKCDAPFWEKFHS
jgi:hypothetical protein